MVAVIMSCNWASAAMRAWRDTVASGDLSLVPDLGPRIEWAPCWVDTLSIRVARSWACDDLSLSSSTCLLYTSDAADEEDSVDLGGRRIIKKKKKEKDQSKNKMIVITNNN
eukprot:TRINITY_DN1581_c0_g2_i3.p1 TRINITY_DN1581_c0_g2~~TRINITY_DN1581_c0_g2_i3.p1  ORF type:complete len:111 (-),score=16.36 TRINITY_DN1581_c0_g2_i3:32-364(-)